MLWLEMKKFERLLDLGIGTAAELIQSTAVGIIDFIIKPQLRHSTRSTTMIYLQWLMDMLGVVLPLKHEAEFNDLEVP